MRNPTPALRPVEGHNRALCCECGEVRLVKATYRGRNKNYLSEGSTPEQLARVQARGHDLNIHPYWRMLVDLPCSNCGTLRRHAWLRDHDRHANYAEKFNRVDAPNPSR